MPRRISNVISAAILALAVLFSVGCASVKSTAQYYIPYTTKVYPPKAPKAEVPILGKAPKDQYEAIGKLAFQTTRGWSFLLKSMEYNARIHGADAVLVKNVNTRQERQYNYVPPQMDWIPQTYYYQKGNKTYGGTNWIPFYRPGYVSQWIEDITAIDAEMIILK